jgi:ketosteroid isomerase-like protein
MRCIILPLILLVAVACQPGVGPLTDEDVAALRDLGQTYVRGFSANDAGTVAAVYAEGAVEMPPNIPARDGVDAIRAAYASYFEAGAETVEFTIREGGRTEPVTQTGKYLSIARRQEDGSWRYAAMIWNSDQPLEQLPSPE